MKNHRVIIAIISIAVGVVLGAFLFKHPELIKLMTSDCETITLTAMQKFFKNLVISVSCGGTIYIIFYAIPHEYKMVNQKKKDE